jgi:uncharacterized phage protein (TIGR02216 family)
LRLSPAVFWSLSLPEWRALIAPPLSSAPLARSEFEDLLLRFPD